MLYAKVHFEFRLVLTYAFFATREPIIMIIMIFIIIIVNENRIKYKTVERSFK